MRPALVGSLLLGLVGVAGAQEARVVRDEWRAHFRGTTKVGWEHQRITERPGAPADQVTFLIDEASWLPVTGGVVHVETRVETDASGRVRRRASTRTTPWGTTTTAVEPSASGLRYRVQVRERPPLEGELGHAHSETILGLLALRGAQPPGKRTVRALDLPGEGLQQRAVEARREGERWRLTRFDRVELRAADGAFVRATREGVPGEVWLPATEADAADRGVAPVEAFEAAPESATFTRLSVTRPSDEWALSRHTDDDRALIEVELLGHPSRAEPIMIGIEHPAGVGVAAVRLSMRVVADEEQRVRHAELMRGSLLRKPDNPTRDGPVLGPAEASTWRDLPAVRFRVGGSMDNEPVAGFAYLVGLSDGLSAFLLLAWPAELAEPRAADIAAAEGALGLVTSPGSEWVRRDLQHATLELPGHWAPPAVGSTSARSPMGASQVGVGAGVLPAQGTLAQAQARWLERLRSNERLLGLAVERQEEGTVGGRAVLLTFVGAKLESQGVLAELRSALCLLDRGGGAFVQLTIVAFDTDWDPGAVERVLESVRWAEER